MLLLFQMFLWSIKLFEEVYILYILVRIIITLLVQLVVSLLNVLFNFIEEYAYSLFQKGYTDH